MKIVWPLIKWIIILVVGVFLYFKFIDPLFDIF